MESGTFSKQNGDFPKKDHPKIQKKIMFRVPEIFGWLGCVELKKNQPISTNDDLVFSPLVVDSPPY